MSSIKGSIAKPGGKERAASNPPIPPFIGGMGANSCWID